MFPPKMPLLGWWLNQAGDLSMRIPDAPDARKYENLQVNVVAPGVIFARNIAGTIQRMGFGEQQAWDIIRASRPSIALKTLAYGLTVCGRIFEGEVDAMQFVRVIAALSARDANISAKIARQVMRNVFGFPLPPARCSAEFFNVLRGSVVVVTYYFDNLLAAA
jgi:hypothetical protein